MLESFMKLRTTDQQNVIFSMLYCVLMGPKKQDIKDIDEMIKFLKDGTLEEYLKSVKEC